MTITVYGTDGCHLCHEADTLIQRVLQSASKEPSVAWIDISSDPALVEAYGTRIPVVKNGGFELDWPFDEGALQAILFCDP